MKILGQSIVGKELIHKWGTWVFLGILDQSFFSGANFIINFLLGRWLNESSYGAYSIVFSIFLFISGIPSALVWEPIGVFGVSQKENLKEYLGKQLQFQIILTVISASLMILFSILLDSGVRPVFFSVFLSMPLILLIWFFRQVCYLLSRIDLAFLISLTYAGLFIIGILFLKNREMLTSSSVFIGMAVASVGASVVGNWFIKIPIRFSSIIKSDIIKNNWRYGKFILVASFASGISSFLYLPLIGIWLGLAEAGAFRAMQNLILPLQQVVIVFALILLPQLSRIVEVQGEKRARLITNILILFTIFMIVGYTLVLHFLGRSVVEWLYQKDSYLTYTWILALLGIVFIVTAVTQLLGIAVRALKKPQAVLWSKVTAALVALTFGVFAVYRWNLIGVLLASFVSATAECLVILWFYICKKSI